MMSVTKACSAVALLTLVDQGAVDMTEKVATYWPAFSGDGKEDMTVRTLISHQSGVIYADAAPAGSLWDGHSVEAALEAAAPEWEPGTGGAYHSFTYGPFAQWPDPARGWPRCGDPLAGECCAAISASISGSG